MSDLTKILTELQEIKEEVKQLKESPGRIYKEVKTAIRDDSCTCARGDQSRSQHGCGSSNCRWR